MDAMTDPADVDATRRTYLAAERTWLAWWRSGIATATAAIAVGGVVPHLVGGSRAPYVVLGAGYALLSIAMFVVGGRRQTAVERALGRGDYEGIPPHHVAGFTVAGAVLAIGTLVAILANA
jgi:inner membrane protein YidH